MNPQSSASDQYFSSHSSRKTLVIIILSFMLVAAIAFGAWAFSGRQNYKNNSDKNAQAAVRVAEQQLTTQLQAQFAQQSKQPYKTFAGSPTYGSVTFSYPKNWSAYVDTTQSSEPINGYFYPDTVPGAQSNSAFALRVELVTTDYSQILQQLNGQVTQGQLTAKAYVPPKMQGVANVTTGTYFTGQINNSQGQPANGAMVVIRVRDKTLEIYTESTDFKSDFDNVVLSSLKFTP